MYLTSVLAQHILDTPNAGLPSSVRERTLACILDALSAAICGFAASGPTAVRRSAPQIFGSGAATVWMSRQTAAPLAALACNAAAASALDMDDGHRAARGHPGACVIPAALTHAGEHVVSAGALLAAIVAGYDVGVRIAAAQNPQGIATRQSGRWAAFAAAATVGFLLQARPDHLAQALAIAGVLAPNQQANGSSGYSRLTGNDVKEGIAWSAATGLMALQLAIHGHTGPLDLLDHPGYYDRDRILDRLGSHWEITGTYFKPYACCRYIHAPLDAFLDLAGRHNLLAGEIVAVTVDTFGWALKLGNTSTPQNLVDVQYSLPYCLAIAAIDGGDALAVLDAGVIGRADLTGFAGKISVRLDRDLDRLFPAETLARVTIETGRGRFQSPVTVPTGDPARPLAFDGLERKFRRVTSPIISPVCQQNLVDCVLALGSGDGDLLPQALARLGDV